MTALVIVSHSEQIAAGTQALLNQMTEGVDVITVGGNQGEIGTSFDAISEVINQLEDDAICFFDIGSSEMNLDMAIEMYTGSQRIEKVDAPIVEGSFIAAVALSTGQSMDQAIASVYDTYSK
ncbi:dihydroxyacetone kinase phosphoryl donor subunit DhaM [Staphylococcus canis]|uniref:phosphoenolpyruvate--glycerone phosphotransferase n=1 Tax=Staphylococcus canis TaxID=2724942 RepID=A0ABS0T6Q1_9STAP|nr:dihydroxyacetone kinase phosphoryl donor subunit DhaM [Staphylococcus canis]MBI5974432.1 PTS-dependent dihydroxyacetone kinase phosphotransferase subunit DhaM [Staphylococcus canis]